MTLGYQTAATVLWVQGQMLIAIYFEVIKIEKINN